MQACLPKGLLPKLSTHLAYLYVQHLQNKGVVQAYCLVMHMHAHIIHFPDTYIADQGPHREAYHRGFRQEPTNVHHDSTRIGSNSSECMNKKNKNMHAYPCAHLTCCHTFAVVATPRMESDWPPKPLQHNHETHSAPILNGKVYPTFNGIAKQLDYSKYYETSASLA